MLPNNVRHTDISDSPGTGSANSAYWIVNLVDRQVEVYTLPYADGSHSRQDFTPGQDVPVVIDGVEAGRIRIGDILP